jgi:tRNA G18 (ribose-2'-O)-methylase SpoU
MRKITNQELGRLTPEEFKQADKIPVVVVLDNVRSMSNIGAFFRTADAFAIERIILCGITATPPNREIHKTALGAEQTVEWSYEPTTLAAVEKLNEQGYQVWAVEQVEGSVMLQDFRMEQECKYAMVFGNEVAGVDQAVVDKCCGAVEIPQRGTKHSINVSVSGGVVLWSLFCEYQKLL